MHRVLAAALLALTIWLVAIPYQDTYTYDPLAGGIGVDHTPQRHTFACSAPILGRDHRFFGFGYVNYPCRNDGLRLLGGLLALAGAVVLAWPSKVQALVRLMFRGRAAPPPRTSQDSE